MACSKWEEIGLLYCSDELDKQEAGTFENHLEECEECKRELEMYTREKEQFFTVAVLGESPSPAVDTEILRVCKSAKKQFTSTSFWPLVFKRSVFSATFFVLGFVVVSYFVLNVEKAGEQKSQFTTHLKTDDSLSGKTATASVRLVNDSTRDSLNSKDSAVYFSKTRGNLDQGVIPVMEIKDK